MRRCQGMVVGIVLLFPALAAAEPQHGEFPAEQASVLGVEREYRLVVPESVDLSKPAPLVFAFHGFLIDSKDLMPVYTRLNQTAARHGFILVYPNANGISWGLSLQSAASDLQFFDVLLARLSARYQVDQRRVYVVGMSNGGYFAHLVGQFRSQTVAAVCSHSGPLGVHTLFGIHAERKFPVLIVHGQDDPLFPPTIARENRDKYRNEGHRVRYAELPGIGHQWATAYDVNEWIWDFFRRHPLPN